MRKSHSLEILVLLAAGMSGIIVSIIQKWYISLVVSILLFAGCSHLVTWLKEETLKEYIEAVRNSEEVSK